MKACSLIAERRVWALHLKLPAEAQSILASSPYIPNPRVKDCRKRAFTGRPVRGRSQSVKGRNLKKEEWDRAKLDGGKRIDRKVIKSMGKEIQGTALLLSKRAGGVNIY